MSKQVLSQERVFLSEPQIAKLVKAMKEKKPANLRIGKDAIHGDYPVMLSKRNLNKLHKARAKLGGCVLEVGALPEAESSSAPIEVVEVAEAPKPPAKRGRGAGKKKKEVIAQSYGPSEAIEGSGVVSSTYSGQAYVHNQVKGSGVKEINSAPIPVVNRRKGKGATGATSSYGVNVYGSKNL